MDADPVQTPRGKPWILVAGVVVVLAVIAGVYLVRRSAGVTLHGTIAQAGLCYQFQTSHMDESMTVTVRDGSGSVIALTHAGSRQVLTAAELGQSTPPKILQGVPYPICAAQLTYSVKLPKTAVYTVSVGGSDLPTMSYDELAAKHFQLDVTLSPLPGSL